jgi:hypothetical protein
LATAKTKYTNQLFEDRLPKLPSEIQATVKSALDTKAENRTDAQKQLAVKYKTQLKPTGKDLDTALAEYSEYRTQADEINGRLSRESARRQTFAEVRALYDLPGEVETPVLLRGDPLTPGPAVEPGVISSLVTPEPFRMEGSGRRRENQWASSGVCKVAYATRAPAHGSSHGRQNPDASFRNRPGFHPR